MIGYVTLGTNDIKRSAAFYDRLLAEIGAKRIMEQETFIVWGNSPTQAGLSVTKPFDGRAATVGNGVMVALIVKEPAQVNKVYQKALELGPQDEGAAGPRGPGFYAGYFCDPDGNKLNVFCMT
jgi:predicted lactoylglutathione lyase